MGQGTHILLSGAEGVARVIRTSNWWDKDIRTIDDAISVLREARKFNRDSAAYLARVLQVSRYTIFNWEMGMTHPRLDPYQKNFIVEYVKVAQAKRRRLAEYCADCLSLEPPSSHQPEEIPA